MRKDVESMWTREDFTYLFTYLLRNNTTCMKSMKKENDANDVNKSNFYPNCYERCMHQTICHPQAIMRPSAQRQPWWLESPKLKQLRYISLCVWNFE